VDFREKSFWTGETKDEGAGDDGAVKGKRVQRRDGFMKVKRRQGQHQEGVVQVQGGSKTIRKSCPQVLFPQFVLGAHYILSNEPTSKPKTDRRWINASSHHSSTGPIFLGSVFDNLRLVISFLHVSSLPTPQYGASTVFKQAHTLRAKYKLHEKESCNPCLLKSTGSPTHNIY